ncbi:MAG: flavodoxin domain-containing protein [Actinomycetota bacterium]|nr:flavodoxin domain-containing protein [Actinomycetota bacterium]
MKILIAYATRFGTTEKCAGMLAEILKEKGNEVKLMDLKKNKSVKIQNDLVVVGGSFVAFRMNAIVKRFVKRNLDTLLNMKTGIFMCGADEDWEKEIKKGFPEELLDKAVAKGYFGFEMNWDKMNPMVRNIMQKAWKTTEPVSKINIENIRKFAEEIAEALP